MRKPNTVSTKAIQTAWFYSRTMTHIMKFRHTPYNQIQTSSALKWYHSISNQYNNSNQHKQNAICYQNHEQVPYKQWSNQMIQHAWITYQNLTNNLPKTYQRPCFQPHDKHDLNEQISIEGVDSAKRRRGCMKANYVDTHWRQLESDYTPTGALDTAQRSRTYSRQVLKYIYRRLCWHCFNFRPTNN